MDRDRQADRLRQIAAELLQMANELVEVPFPEKVRRICYKLGAGKPGTGEAARQIGVDPSTIIDWRKRPDNWHPLKKNEEKVNQVYKDLFGEE